MRMKIRKSIGVIGTLGAMAFTMLAAQSQAANVTPDVIFGSGNANGSFTVDQGGSVELGLRAKQRYPAANIFNYDGTDTYTFEVGSATASSRPNWNFEWSINSNFDGGSTNDLNDLVYQLKLDTDPGAGILFTTWDPVNGVPYADHAIGTNATGNGGGTVAADATEYGSLIGSNNVAQNSWASHWFDGLFDPNAAGTYRIELLAFADGGVMLASTGINVVVSAIPLPAALPLYGAGIAVLGFLGWRRKKQIS
ncbi:hypothetical protein A9Q83_05950 [Alphaproteobacteria bacterium 46_93_T64]|nr:hypothetical protein A9Q83_05950 [Alphaproteobacteria bacterium 46_93_T64]